MAWFRRFRADEGGTTAIQYSMLAALVAVITIGALTQMAAQIVKTFNTIETEVETASS